MLYDLYANYPAVFNVFVLALGACWGSFLNVVVYRLPLGKSIVYPGSTCTTCGTPIRFFDNIPVFSWLILRGKSRCCKTPFSIRYPLVEAVTALLFFASLHACGVGNWPLVLVGWVLVSLLLCAALIDYDTQMLPDIFTVWGMVAGVILSMLVPALHGIGAETTTMTSVYGVDVETITRDPALLVALRGGLQAAIGAIVGAGTLLWIAILAEAILRKEAMGFGDILLMGCIGAFCGWQGALFAIFGGALIGCAGVIVIALLNKIFGFSLSAGKTSSGGPVPLEAEQPPSEDPVLSPQDTAQTANGKQSAKGSNPAAALHVQTTAASAATRTAENPATNAGIQTNSQAAEAQQLGFGVAIPFGPWLAAGAMVYFLFLREETAAYLENLRVLFFPG